VAILKPAFACLAMSTVMLTGCTQTGTAGEPTYACTPSDGSTAYPCYQVQYDEKVKEDKLYAEAETVYRTYLAEDERINRIGGITEPTPVLLETTEGEFLTDILANYKELRTVGATATGGEFKISWFKRRPRDTYAGSVATLMVCTDASSVQMAVKGKPPKPGRLIEEIGYLVREGEQLKIAASRSKVVTTC
jgi:hypothetical protein